MRAYEHFGDYLRNPAFAAFHRLSIKAFSLYQEHTGEADLAKPRNDLIRRMMYVAEAMSVSLRMSSSWALSHPAFSLCRDRYEQCVRFSWLARQTDAREWYRYIADLYFTHHRLKNAFGLAGIELGVELDDGGLGELPPETRKKFAYWSKTPLEQLVSKRDYLAGVTGSKLDGESLKGFYNSIYRQGSSVSHYDLYSINMLGLHKSDTQLVLAPDPALPIVLVMHCAIFDLIQCAEAIAVMEVKVPIDAIDGLRKEWWDSVKQTGMLDDGEEAKPQEAKSP